MKYVGKVFSSKNYGDFIILEHNAPNDVVIKFVDTGWVTTAHMSQIRVGSVKDFAQPTILGVGIIGSRLSLADRGHKSYKNWYRIISRCYNENLRDKHPSYVGCTVSEDFLHYDRFKAWYIKQKNWDNDDFVLDKDLLSSKTNKVYSAETCIFIPKSINSMLTTTKAKRGGLPMGVSLKTGDTKYTSNCCIRGSDKHLGMYVSIEEAFVVYKEVKEAYFKEVANEWKEEIDPRAYQALMNWAIEIDD